MDIEEEIESILYIAREISGILYLQSILRAINQVPSL